MRPRDLFVGFGLVALLWSCCAVDTAAGRSDLPRLPEGEAGRILAHAIEAAGGWQHWLALRDVAHISTLTLLDPIGNVNSQSIGWFKAPLHQGMRARMDSIGVTSQVVLGVDGNDTWILRDGEAVTARDRLEVTHFNLVSNLFWFSLPFSLAEMPVTITDLGEKVGEGQVRWRRLKAVFDAPNPAVPGEWFVLYFNSETGLLDRVHAHIAAPFLRHTLWVGKWIEYRDCDGLQKERVRKFFPADINGEIIGTLVAEQLVEYVRTNNGFAPELFKKPAHASGARSAGPYY